MCPFCLSTTLGVVIAGTVSTGGLAALAVKISRRQTRTPEIKPANTNERRKEDVNSLNR